MEKHKKKKIKLNRRELLAGTASLGAIALSSKLGNSQETNPDNFTGFTGTWRGRGSQGWFERHCKSNI